MVTINIAGICVLIILLIGCEQKRCIQPSILDYKLEFTEYRKRPQTKRIIIHHLGAPNSHCDFCVNKIHEFHKIRWAGVGYHFVIRNNGNIEQGRKLNAIGAHAKYNNYDSIGICLNGNFEQRTPSDAQIKSLKLLITWLCCKYNLNPKHAVIGHCEVKNTKCPGKKLYYLLNSIKSFCSNNIN